MIAEEFGSPGRARTADLVINSHPLYQLSYRGSIQIFTKIALLVLFLKDAYGTDAADSGQYILAIFYASAFANRCIASCRFSMLVAKEIRI